MSVPAGGERWGAGSSVPCLPWAEALQALTGTCQRKSEYTSAPLLSRNPITVDKRSGNRRVLSGSSSLALALVVAFVAACDAGQSGQDEPVLRDSAGITIAENPGPGAPGLEWTLGDSPLLTLGAGGAVEGQLFRVVGAARLHDGRIVVANAGTHEVLVFGPGGDPLGAVGGEGSGPGEYQDLRSLVPLPGDTLILYDTRLRRLTTLSPGGEVIRTATLPDAGDDLSVMFMRLAGYTGPELVFVAPPVRHTGMTSPGRVVADTFRVLTTEPDGTRATQIAAVPGTETWFRSYTSDTGGRGIINMPVPFGAAVHHTSGGGRFFLGRSDRPEIAVYADSEVPALLIRRPRQRRPVTAADREAFEDHFLAEAGGADRYRQARQRLLEEVPFATVYPQFTGLVATRDGDLWVREPESPAADTATWSIYGPEGVLEGRAQTPADLEIQEIGVDFLLALTTDDLGVERIELWELRALDTDDR